MTEKPLVSVNVIVYNRQHTIRACMESILQQDYPNLEIIVVDDGSSDKTVDLIKSYIDPRIKLHLNEKNKGIIYTRNRALSLSNGQFVAILDSDDVSIPERISKQVTYLVENKEIAMVASFIDLKDEQGNALPDWEADRKTTTSELIKNTLWKENCIAHSSVTIRKEIICKYGYDEGYSEDYMLWMNLVADGYAIAKLKEPLTIYMVNTISATKEQENNYNHLDMTRKIKWNYLQVRIKKRRIRSYDIKILWWLFASYFPFLRNRLQ